MNPGEPESCRERPGVPLRNATEGVPYREFFPKIVQVYLEPILELDSPKAGAPAPAAIAGAGAPAYPVSG